MSMRGSAKALVAGQGDTLDDTHTMNLSRLSLVVVGLRFER